MPHVPGAYVVNIGDCLMRWTNDIYVSTPASGPAAQTRAAAPSRCRGRRTRMSWSTALPGTGTPKYAPIRAADYLQSRLDATYNETVGG